MISFNKIFVVFLFLLIACSWSWYRAGVQQQVFEREGIHMTTWEIFIGVKPREQAIIIRGE